MTVVVFCHKQFLFTFVTNNLSITNNYFVATNIILSSQNFCHDKHTFVVTKDLFCRDKHVCRDKTFVTTKMILVAAPANDKIWVSSPLANIEGPVTN